jgi:hypothetical protein
VRGHGHIHQFQFLPLGELNVIFSAVVARLGHYATSRKVVGLIPDGIIGFLNLPNPSSRTMALRSTQPLTQMSTKNLPGDKGRPARKADNLTAIC